MGCVARAEDCRTRREPYNLFVFVPNSYIQSCVPMASIDVSLVAAMVRADAAAAVAAGRRRRCPADHVQLSSRLV